MAITKTSANSIKSFSKFDNAYTNNQALNNVFLMVGNTNNATAYATSADGITWTARSATGFGNDVGMIRQNGVWISTDAQGMFDATTATAFTYGTNAQTFPSGKGATFFVQGQWGVGGNGSTAGWVWGSRYGGNNTGDGNVVYGNGTWVRVLANSNITYAVDATGILPFANTYNTATSAVTSPERVVFGNGLFIVNGSNGLMSSPDGINWTLRSSAGNFQGSKLLFAGGRFWCSAGAGSGAVYSSPDGINWTALSGPATNSALVGVSYGAGVYVLLLASGALYSSPDASTWTSRTNPVTSTWSPVLNSSKHFSSIQWG